MSSAQDNISLSIDVSADTIYMENAFRVRYIVDNGSITGFNNPEFTDFHLLQGPSRSQHMSIINGTRSSEESVTYYFKPNKSGKFQIPPFELTIKGQSYKSNSPKIIVVPNPDGLHQDPTTGQLEGRLNLPKKSNKRKRYKI